MSAMKQRRQILAPHQLQRLKNQEQALEARLNNQLVMPKNHGIKEDGLSARKKGYFEQFMRDDVQEDKTIIQKQLAKLRSVIQSGSAPHLSNRDRQRVEAQRKTDEEFLKKNLTPKSLYYAKANAPEFDAAKKAVSREIKPEMQRVMDRYVQATRALDPDNPERHLVDRLRPNS